MSYLFQYLVLTLAIIASNLAWFRLFEISKMGAETVAIVAFTIIYCIVEQDKRNEQQ